MSALPAGVQQALVDLCKRRQVARLAALDGLDPSTPVLRLAVEFLPRPGFGAYLMARFEQELSDLLGRPVDLRTATEFAGFPRTDLASRRSCSSRTGSLLQPLNRLVDCPCDYASHCHPARQS